MENTLDTYMKKGKKVLYIDGDAQYRKLVRSAFAGDEYRCTLCPTGLEGLEKIHEIQPDLVIVDYFLPDITGEEVYSRFLFDHRFQSIKHIPFMLLTTNGKVDKAMMYNLGFSACLGKPFNAEHLIDFVEDVLASHEVRMREMNFWDTIREAKDFLERVVESSVDAIVTTDSKGFITYCNLACEDILGYSFEEMIGERISRFLRDGGSELMRMSAILAKCSKLQNYKTVVISKNGKQIPINISISVMRDADGKATGALGITKVVTGESQSEFDSHVSDRMAAVVETAVAVNHAINNPLVPILGNAQYLLQTNAVQDEDVKKRLRVIVKNAMRIRDITQKLAAIKNPVTVEYLKGTRMLDIEASA